MTAFNAHAITVVDTYTGWIGATTSNWRATAQTFMVPAVDSTLDSWQFGLAGRPSPSTLTFSIFSWSGAGNLGPALFSTSVPWGTSPSDPVVPIHLGLTPGGYYGAVFTLPDGSESVHFHFAELYPGGNGFWGFDGVTWREERGLDHKFRATFSGGTPQVPDTGATGALAAGGLIGLAIARRHNK